MKNGKAGQKHFSLEILSFEKLLGFSAGIYALIRVFNANTYSFAYVLSLNFFFFFFFLRTANRVRQNLKFDTVRQSNYLVSVRLDKCYSAMIE